MIPVIVSISHQALGIATVLIGLGMVIMAFIDSPWQLQIISGLIGLGFITLGLVQVKRGQERKKTEGRIDIIVSKLNEIQQEIKKGEPSKGTGVVIADVLSSGLKYYSEYITRQQKAEDNE